MLHDDILRAIDLNDGFQLLAVITEQPRARAAEDADVIRLVADSVEDADVLWVSTAADAVAHVMRGEPSLTVFDARGLDVVEVERFFSGINGNRDTMGRGGRRASMLVVVEPRMLANIGLVAQDIWSCRMAFHA